MFIEVGSQLGKCLVEFCAIQVGYLRTQFSDVIFKAATGHMVNCYSPLVGCHTVFNVGSAQSSRSGEVNVGGYFVKAMGPRRIRTTSASTSMTFDCVLCSFCSALSPTTPSATIINVIVRISGTAVGVYVGESVSSLTPVNDSILHFADCCAFARTIRPNSEPWSEQSIGQTRPAQKDRAGYKARFFMWLDIGCVVALSPAKERGRS